MYIDFKKIFSVLALLILGAVIGITGLKLIQNFQEPKQTVSVVGTGEIDATTDQATITIQVKNTSTTYEKAQEENKIDVDKLKSDLIKLGIPESRITVSSYSQPIFRNIQGQSSDVIQPEAKMMVYPIRPDITPTVTTNLTLILDPIKNIEKIYDVVSKNSNSQVLNSYYSLKSQKTWEAKAKEEALKDTRNQVESIAKINHLKVGKLLSIEDSNNPRPFPLPMEATSGGSPSMMKEAQLDSSSQEVVQNQNENVYYSEQSVKINASYTAVYELY
ncbi:MAG: SIMPL domain-containing protein [Patescibacteria group bacterium]|jgi:uncharacterized protein YggE